MPFTDEFSKLRRNYRSKYSDVARADSLAFRKALKEKIPTWKEKEKRIRRKKNENNAFF